MLVSSRAVVLNCIKYSETSLIVYVYSELHGRLNLMVKGARRKKSPLKANFFQPFFLLNITYYYKQSRDLHTLKEVSSDIVLNSIPFDVRKSSVAIFLAEVFYRAIKEHEPNPVLFSFLHNSIHKFEHIEQNVANFHIEFMLQLSKYLGFYPHNTYDASNTIFDLESGYFKNTEPIHPHFLNETLSAHFHELLQHNESSISNAKTRNEILDKLIDYYRLHLGHFGEIKSHQVLQELFR